MSLNLEELLKNGYFPKELPPAFNTDSFAVFASKHLSACLKLTDRRITRAGVHNLGRYAGFRRKLSIPNPMNQINVANCMVNNWEDIERKLASSISMSTPVLNKGGRAINSKLSFDDLPRYKAQNRAVSKYILLADVLRFYHSIYTHSIPWAVHGKSVAKKDRTSNLWANELDRVIRNGQDGQTLGIPIGPDTSLVTAELILCAVEREIGNSYQAAFRLIDDMEIGFKGFSEAQSYMSILQESLNNYELSLHPNKTKISELPCRIEGDWVPVLRSFKFRDSEKALNTDLVHYFDIPYELYNRFPEEAVLTYAISRLKSIPINCASNMKICEDLMLQSCIAEPAALRHCLNLMMQFSKAGCQLDNDDICQALNLIAQQHAALGHGSEVAWAMWGLINFNLPVEDETTRGIVISADPICSLLLLDANSRGLVKDKGLLTGLEGYMTGSELQDERWLLAYEADRQGWLPSIEAQNHVSAHYFFRGLKKSGVSFYNPNATGFPLISFTGY